MSRNLSSVLAILVIAAIGVPLWIFVIQKRPTPLAAPPREVGPSLVTTRTLAWSDYPLEVEAFGTLLPRRRATLVVERSGRVTSVHESWRPGLSVSEGEELLRIDRKPFELDLARAEAAQAEAEAGEAAAQRERELSIELLANAESQFEIAERELARLESLEVRGQVGASLVDQARTAKVAVEASLGTARGRVSAAEVNVSAARARAAQAAVVISLAQDSLSRTVITAPFDGELEGRAPTLGAFLAAGTPVAECLDLSALHLVARVRADHLGAMREGLTATVRLPSRPELAVEGRVRSVSSAVDPISRSAAVEVEFENTVSGEDGTIRSLLPSGLFAETTIHADAREKILWIDRRHLTWRNEIAQAWVFSPEERALKKPLVLGEALGEGFAVLEGLRVGEELITGPLDRLVEGAPCTRTRSAGESKTDSSETAELESVSTE